MCECMLHIVYCGVVLRNLVVHNLVNIGGRKLMMSSFK
jgi:hypothetical protein